ncbi:hypothetical protein GOBAR_AA24569 [Gossypium barbadense]|uniref:SCP domain-containing protein n=1 Tax=Gossypium barbadense TaxID=3634 RepID=A0A2P5WYF2_GOSBA|nr:hypothetical protein GOBAR_AA24569 [Gossypium barbadense]
MCPGTMAAPAVLPRAARENLEAHNQARAAVGVGPLKWSKQPQPLRHMVVETWVKEKGYYDYATSTRTNFVSI